MRLIDSEELAKYAWSYPDVTVDGDGYINPYTIENFAEEHAVDAAPAVHARWEFPIFTDEDDGLDPRVKCSECGGVEAAFVRWKYCPNCGARMDGGWNDG